MGLSYVQSSCLKRFFSCNTGCVLAFISPFLQVYKVSAPNQKEFAVKRVSFNKMSDDLRQGFRHEVDLLQKFAGTGGVIKLYSFEEFPLDEVMYMVLELGEMDLHTMLKRKRVMWAQQSQSDPFIADSNFICNLWHDILRSVKVLPVGTCTISSLVFVPLDSPPVFRLAFGMLQ